MKRYYSAIITACLLTLLTAQAGEPLAYDTFSLKIFHQIQLLIPKRNNDDRVYLLTRLRRHVVGADLLIDQTRLFHNLGSTETRSFPPDLVQGFGTQYKEILQFQKSSVRTAQKEIIFGFQTDDGKEYKVAISGKRLLEIKQSLH